ncbi:hypothetical protein FJT64_026228 [Amphibalanus amphitrite]|uniref:C-type lectin domain-containing protein n=1 Tax=Amphibalanus amphitrite TaxID=1232801 RepID=A0A6A4W2H5_AMPAM|nr:hypothetical protein FJT64_026228 [Amphibalanus amphitrite]
MRPRASLIVLVILPAMLLAALVPEPTLETFRLVWDLPLLGWRQVWAPSLITCIARCRQASGCEAAQWTGGCRLADVEASAGGETPNGGSGEVWMYRRVKLSGVLEPAPATTQATAVAAVAVTAVVVVTAGSSSQVAVEPDLTATPPCTFTTPTVTPTTTVAPPTSATGVIVDGRCYWRTSSSWFLSYNEARNSCQRQRDGGDLASIYTQPQLAFLWSDPNRPNDEEWLGLYTGTFGGFRNPDGSPVPKGVTWTTGGVLGSHLVLPRGRTQGELERVVGPTLGVPGALYPGMVCDVPMAG